jgi:hypothetical protein
MHIQCLALTPWREPLATISTKRCIDTGRVYQPGFAIYITLGFMNTPDESPVVCSNCFSNTGL